MMSVPAADFTDVSPVGRKSTDKASNSSSNHSTHSILPSPPASPPLRTRAPLPRQDTDVKPLSPNEIERDVEAALRLQIPESYEMRPMATSLDPSYAMTPASTHMSIADSEHDPLLLRSKQLTDDEIELRRRASRRAGASRWGISKLGAFYTEQNEHINQLLKPLSKHAEEAQETEDAGRLPVKIAVRASLIANCCLAVLQIYAAASSLSLSFFATASDSVFDPFANVVLYRLHIKSQKADPLKYPGGGSRLETIGNILYSFLMGSVSLILIVESIRALASHDPNDDDTFHIPATVAVGVAFFTKLMLFLYCYSIRGMSSQVQVLWEDHRNDLLINGFGIFTNAAGAKIAWFIDPMGAIIISCVIIGSWSWTAYTEFRCLAGRSADPDFLRLVVYKAMTFSDSITAIDSCKAYHSGPGYVVEVDIVMPGETPLWKAHDVSQDLQDQLETLPGVDRAFVHVDHEVSHRPEHRKNK